MQSFATTQAVVINGADISPQIQDASSTSIRIHSPAPRPRSTSPAPPTISDQPVPDVFLNDALYLGLSSSDIPSTKERCSSNKEAEHHKKKAKERDEMQFRLIEV